MIDTSKWKKFKVGTLFQCQTTKPQIEIEKGDIPYVTRSAVKNGIGSFVSQPEQYTLNLANCITIGAEGKFAFYQPEDFVSGVKIYTLRHEKLNKKNALFICTLLNCAIQKYNYGRARILEKIKKEIIKLPVTSFGAPDWEYMEQFMTPFLAKKPITKNKHQKTNIHAWDWQKYRLSDLFEIKKGKRLTSEDQIPGKTPYIGAIDSNNGVSNYIGQAPIHQGNTISLSYNGSVGEAFYQPQNFWATDDVNVLYPKFNLNKYIALFICTILKKEKYRFSYGRKWTLEQMKNSFIKLPSLKMQGKDTPDWNLMESYTKNLPYGDLI